MGGDHHNAITKITLLRRINENPTDQSNWSEFVNVYSPIIRTWCLHWGLQESDAFDVTQNVLFRLTSRLPNFQYDKSKSFRGWLKTLTHHAWHDFVTETGYRNRGSGDSGVYDRLQSTEARIDLTARVEATFDQELLQIAIDTVKAKVAPATWDAFRMTAFEGILPQDAADKLGIRVSQVYLAKHRVQKQLQDAIVSLERE